jgi:formylglycine-generating enzyme required for sulfatase activity
MDWGQIALALAETLQTTTETVGTVTDTVQEAANQPQNGKRDWLEPGLVYALIGFVGALVGAAVAFWMGRRNLKQQRQLFEEEWQRKQDDEKRQHQEHEDREKAAREEQAQTDEDRYLGWIINQNRFLNITGLRTRAPVEVELERVYISLTADPHTMARIDTESELPERPGAEDLERLFGREQSEKIGIAEALTLIDLDRIFGLVILGGPGTGKTTVLKYVALTYARGLQGERLDQSRPLLPLFVTLRAITAATRNTSLADYMYNLCNTAGCNVSPGFVDQRLRVGDCLVLLDGLDEVADESQRRRVAQWITDQRAAYGRNPFVITCRIAGFREGYLPPGFLRMDIRDFDQEEVEQFAHNWYMAVETMLRGDSEDARRQGQEAGEDLIRAIQGNDRVKQLAVNPLMLSIIALVHRYRATLPQRRVDLYQECVEVLLGHWDEARGLHVRIPPGKSLQVLQPLALWLHEQKQSAEDGDRLAHREDIVSLIAPHLVSIGLQTADAKGFLDSIRDRSGLLIERALDVFGFQHQTFQEYLAALEIAAQGRLELLLNHFGDAYWREVTLLYAGSQNATDLLNGILQLPDELVMANWPLVLQLRDEALSVAEETRRSLATHPFMVLQQAQNPDTAVRAAIHARSHRPDADTLLQRLAETQDDLIKGHLILLLSETGDARGIDALRPLLTESNSHLRSLAGLALDMLGFEDRKVLDDLLMVRVPAGEFIMGSEQAYGAGAPRRLQTGAYLIDRFPLTNGQYRRFVENGGYQKQQYWSPEGWQWKEQERISAPRYLDDPRLGVRSAPVVGISWYEAEAYATWAGKRLPTEQEWERAARGDQDAREFPWGDEFATGRCNTSEAGIYQMTPVGSYPNGVSPHGCYDMAGNVWEWTSSFYQEGQTSRVLRGGSWGLLHGLARCAYRYWNLPDVRSYHLGVRFSRTL